MDAVEDRVLNKEAVIEILQDVIAKENIVEPVYNVTSGASKGDGYLSFITRVDIEGKNKDLHLVIKHAPKNEGMRELMPVNRIFDAEIKFYSIVIPAFEEFQKELGIKNPFNSYAKCFKTNDAEGQELLVFENIKEQGFSVHEKSKPMSDAHVKLVMREYGKFHAISLAMKEHAKDKMDTIEKELIIAFREEDYKQEFLDMQRCGIEKIMSLFDKNKDSGILSALEKLRDNFMEFFVNMLEWKGDCDVVTHGDCWCNNMMFKCQNGSSEPSELRLFDFQLAKLGSAAVDLIYFFYVTASQEMLDNYEDYIKIYYDSLKAYLFEMGCDAEKLFPYSTLLDEWKRFAKYGLLIATIIFRVMFREDDEIVDFTDNKDAKDTFMADSKNDEKINERYKSLALHLYNNGYL